MSGDFTSNAGYGLAAMNLKSNFIGSGAQIAAIPSPPTGKIAICNLTGAGFSKGAVYEYNGTIWVAVGGDISAILQTYMRLVVWINEPFPRHELWTKVTVGATVANNDTDGGYTITTSTTLDNRSTVSKMKSARISFAKNFEILGRIDLNLSTRLLFRYGVGMPAANDFASTRKRIGLEIDNNTDTNKNMFGASCDGTTMTSSDTGQVGTGTHNWRIDFITGVNMKVYRDGTLVLTKTTNIPSSGDTDSGNNEAFTVVGQTRNTSSKIIKIMYVQCAGEEGQIF